MGHVSDARVGLQRALENRDYPTDKERKDAENYAHKSIGWEDKKEKF